MIRRLTRAQGTPVTHLGLSLLPKHSLINITTVSLNRYVLETLDETNEYGTRVHVGRIGPIKGTISGYLGIRRIDIPILRLGQCLKYRSCARAFSTSAIIHISILLS